jgi:hypothetical protein
MPVARCGCGSLTATIAAYSPVVALCHCTDCQRRSGSPFGVAGYFPADAVMIAGDYREWSRPTASGGTLINRFCLVCGSTVFWTTGLHSGMIGIAAGAFADPAFPPPLRSVWEQDRLAWVDVAAPQHFDRGSRG